MPRAIKIFTVESRHALLDNSGAIAEIVLAGVARHASNVTILTAAPNKATAIERLRTIGLGRYPANAVTVAMGDDAHRVAAHGWLGVDGDVLVYHDARNNSQIALLRGDGAPQHVGTWRYNQDGRRQMTIEEV